MPTHRQPDARTTRAPPYESLLAGLTPENHVRDRFCV